MQIKHTFLFTLILGLAWAGYLFGFILGPDPGVNGVFGESRTCAMSGCHTSFPVNAAGGSVNITGLPTDSGWVPGQTYPLTITVQRAGQRVFGFQLSAVADGTNQQAGTLAAVNQAVQIKCGVGDRQVNCGTAGAVQYAEHTNANTTSTFTVNWTAPSSANAGTVRFNLAGNAANGDRSNQGDFIYTRVDRVSSASATTPPANTFYFPQVADGFQADGISWKTTIFITNPAGTSTAAGTITFTTSAGSSFNISLVDETGMAVSNGNTIPFAIAAGQSRKFVSTSMGALAVGYATVSANADVKGTAVFSEFAANGVLIGEAGVPAASALARQAIFVDTQSGFNTGVAYANPNSSSATITLQLVGSDGAAIGSPVTQTLAGNQHTTAFVNQLFSSGPAFAGTMQIISNHPLAAIALRFAPSGSFTTLPPIPLNSAPDSPQ